MLLLQCSCVSTGGNVRKDTSLTTFGSCKQKIRGSELLHCFFHCTFIVPHSLCGFHCTVKILPVKCLLEGIGPGFELCLNLEKGTKGYETRNHCDAIMLPGYVMARVALFRDQNLRLDLLQGLRITGITDSFPYLHHLQAICY